jgi:hypothetical protein
MQRDGHAECRIISDTLLVPVLGFTLMTFSFGRSVGYTDGGLDELDVVKMRDTEKLSDLKDRYSVYSEMALSPSESADLIGKYQKEL